MLERDAELDAFCQDFFPQVRKRHAEGMDRIAKVTVIFELVEPGDVIAALKRVDPVRLGQWQHLLLPPTPSPSAPAPAAAPPSRSAVARLFISFVAADKRFLEELIKHLSSLRQRLGIDIWHAGLIRAGQHREAAILRALKRADIALLLISPDYLATKQSCAEMRAALQRSTDGTAQVIPIILRSCAWQETPLGSLLPLPKEGRPVDLWRSGDAAWLDVAQGLHNAILFPASTLRRSVALPVDATKNAATQRPSFPLAEIFRVSGQPSLNFVEPSQLTELCLRMAAMGQGLVVEGPSGIGKTTAVKRALAELQPPPRIVWIASKKAGDLALLRSELAAGFAQGGQLVIDDFHHLPLTEQQQVADLIKVLADDSRNDAKIVLIGINPAGQTLVRNFPDLAGRFTVVSLERQPPEKIDELIFKGEVAANIVFRRRAEFVTAAYGSFFTAQQLCYAAALQAGIAKTKELSTIVELGPRDVLATVLKDLSFKYRELLINFAAYDEQAPPRGAGLALLWLLAQGDEGSVSLALASLRHPQLTPAFAWLRAHLQGLFARTALERLFYWNVRAGVLSLEDPQLVFYLRNLAWPQLAADSGHAAVKWDPMNGPEFPA